MKSRLHILYLVFSLLSLSFVLLTCSQDFYADIPCTSNSDCPKGYHCEANELGNMTCVKGETEQIAGISVLPDEVNFGDVQIRDKKTEQISIINKSTTKSKVSIALDFANKSDELSLEKKTISINYNDTVKVGVSYSPKKTGSMAPNQLNVFLVVNGNSQKIKGITLYGNGIDPTIVAEPDTLDFGELYPGNKSELKTISISNSTGGLLKVSKIYILENSDVDAGGSEISEFELSDVPILPYDISEKGSFFEIKAQFKPKTAGDKIATLIIENTDVDNPKLSVQLKGKGGTCQPNYYDINGKPEDGCEYYCNPKLKGVDFCDGEDNDCDGEIDNAVEDDLCPLADKSKKHVVHLSCIDINGQKECVISECEANYWDLNGKMDDGCEAVCEKTGPEVCDGKDNDCNGKTDEINPNMMCPAAPNTTEAFCNQGKCEYTCVLKYGNCNNDWSDGCETKLQDNDENCGECGKRCDLPNAIGKCEDIQCKVVSCKNGFFDINKDPTDGCEYQCSPQGQEKCNGVDDDCDGNTDNGDIRILCPTASNTTYTCDKKGECRIVACGNGWYDLNGNIEDGCECQAYSSLAGGDSCENPVDLGNFDSATQSYTIQTNLLPVGKSAFYRARFVDNLNEDITNGLDKFHITIRIENNPQNQYRMDIYENSCAPSGKYHLYQNCAEQDYSFATDFRTGSDPDATGENPCYDSGNVPNKNQCSDDSMSVTFKIYRDPHATPTCESASIRINFTR